MFKGSLVALITPFKHHQIDWPAFEHLISWHIEQGSDGLIIGGSTGEGLLLTSDEHQHLVSKAVEIAKGRIPIIAGIAGFGTSPVQQQCNIAAQAGAQAVMIVTSPYLKPSQLALYQFYKTIHDQTELPIIIYNNPGRVGGIMVNDDTLFRLADLPRVVGIKDSTDNLARPANLRQKIKDDFMLLSGDDATTAAFLAQGGDGAISVIANIVPKLCAQLHKAWQTGHMQLFKETQFKLTPIHHILNYDVNPVPIKYAASKLGLCQNELRLPLLSIDSDAHAPINAILKLLD